MVTAIVLVTTEKERVQEAAQAMLEIEGVTEAYSDEYILAFRCLLLGLLFAVIHTRHEMESTP